MPPWHADPKHGRFQNERRLSIEEKRLIRDWVAAGAPEGDPKDCLRENIYGRLAAAETTGQGDRHARSAIRCAG